MPSRKWFLLVRIFPLYAPEHWEDIFLYQKVSWSENKLCIMGMWEIMEKCYENVSSEEVLDFISSVQIFPAFQATHTVFEMFITHMLKISTLRRHMNIDFVNLMTHLLNENWQGNCNTSKALFKFKIFLNWI